MNFCNGILQEQSAHQPRFYFLALTFFTSFWLISLISAVKIVSFVGITLTGGFLVFPFTTTLNSLIVEVYGYKNARQAIWSGTILCITYLVCINIINLIPASPNWILQREFQAILIPQTRIIIASIVAFWFSGFINNYLMAKMKCKGKTLGPRIIFSTFTSIIVDLILFFTIAFWGAIPMSIFFKILLFAFTKKIFCEVILLPLTWYLIDFLKAKEGFEITDSNTNFSPFSFDNIYDFDAYKKMNATASNKMNSVNELR